MTRRRAGDRFVIEVSAAYDRVAANELREIKNHNAVTIIREKAQWKPLDVNGIKDFSGKFRIRLDETRGFHIIENLTPKQEQHNTQPWKVHYSGPFGYNPPASLPVY